MTPAYSPQAILRQIDNRLIDTYAKQHGLFPDLDIPALKETDVEPIYQAILQLDNAAREMVETDLRRVDTLANKRRIQWLFEAIAAGGHSTPEFHKKRGFHDKAIWALLDHPEIFQKVLDYSFPNTNSRHWKKIPYPAGCQHHLETQHLESLQAGICEFFQKRDGRAQHCKVVHSHFDGKEYLVAYPSDYPEKIMEWLDNGAFQPRLHRPSFLVIFVFSKNGAAVDLYAEESIAVLRELFMIWAQAILGRNDIDTKQKRSFDLSRFHTREHGTVFPEDSPVKALAVHRLRFVPHGSSITYTLEGDITQNRHAIYEEMERKRLGVMYIRQIGLEATLQAGSADKEITRKFEISPQSCSLKHEDEAGVIRKFLKDAGIDVTHDGCAHLILNACCR